MPANSEPQAPEVLEPAQLDQAVGGADNGVALIHNTGALRNVSGDNTWSGSIVLSTPTTIG
jgi:hypothetical protein